MNRMDQEPDETVEVVVLKERRPFPGTSGYTFAQRAYCATPPRLWREGFLGKMQQAADNDGWYTIGTETWRQRLSDYAYCVGWWPLDYRSAITE